MSLAHLVFEIGDREVTEWTGRAKEAALTALDRSGLANSAWLAQLVDLGGELVILEVMGQAPDPMRHRQGLRPERLNILQRLERAGIPVCLAFYHGRWETAWLSTLPDPDVIARGPDRSRVGWYAGDDLDLGPCFWITEEFEWPPRERPAGNDPGWETPRMMDGLG